jgi:hypothetical protein
MIRGGDHLRIIKDRHWYRVKGRIKHEATFRTRKEAEEYIAVLTHKRRMEDLFLYGRANEAG